MNALIPTVQIVFEAIDAKAKEFADVVKIGRTHLQDATPITVGQEFSGWASLIERDIERLKQVLDGLYDLAIGGTAVGTGLNAHPEFAERAAKKIAELTGLPFRSHPNKFAALSRARRDRVRVRRTENSRLFIDENRQRYSLARLRSALRHRRTRNSRKRTGQFDYAGKSQSDSIGSDHDGRRASSRKRRGNRFCRFAGKF